MLSNNNSQISVITHPRLTEDGGLCDILLTLLDSHKTAEHLFHKTQIILPNDTLATQLRQFITQKNGVCSNYDLVTLLNPVIQNIYLYNNPDTVLFDDSQLATIIFDLLGDSNLLSNPQFATIYQYLQPQSSYYIERRWSLAQDLSQVFHEYIYLRTSELLSPHTHNFEPWQITLWESIQNVIGMAKTYLDIYQFFMTATGLDGVADQNIYLFNLRSIYPSQLEIVLQIAKFTHIYWFYQSVTIQDYGNLLSDKAQDKIKQRAIKYPNLDINDLHLISGNPLVANLGQSSREFIELLRSYQINIFSNEELNLAVEYPTDTMLHIIQADIASLTKRQNELLNINQTDTSLWQAPLDNQPDDTIKIYNCHDKRREVQVAYQHILQAMEQDRSLQLSDIVLSSPDINDYVNEIKSVFDHEYVLNHNNDKIKLGYNITGTRNDNENNILTNFIEILSVPAIIDNNKLLHLLNLSAIVENFALSYNDIRLIKTWITDNHYCSGIDQQQLIDYGYPTSTVGSNTLADLLDKLSTGLAISATSSMPVYNIYDNMENSNLNTLNSLITLSQAIATLNTSFNQHAVTTALSYDTALDICEDIAERLLLNCENYEPIIALFIYLRKQVITTEVTINIIINLVQQFIEESSKRITLKGVINCLSMQYSKTLEPRLHIILGLNFNEYPRKTTTNQLSNISKYWYLADKNYTHEDKQDFLDIIINCKKQLVITYIGASIVNNNKIQPSNVVTLLKQTVLNSFASLQTESADTLVDYYPELIESNCDLSAINSSYYQGFWSSLANKSSATHQYTCYPYKAPVALVSTTNKKIVLEVSNLVKAFTYNNYCFAKTINISTYNEDFELANSTVNYILMKKLVTAVFAILETQGESAIKPLTIYNMLQNSGMLSPAVIGLEQISGVMDLYHRRRTLYQDAVSYSLDYIIDNTTITLSGKLLCGEHELIYLPEPIASSKARLKDKVHCLINLCIVRLLQEQLPQQYSSLNSIKLYQEIPEHNKKVRPKSYCISHEISPDQLLELVLRWYLASATQPTIINSVLDVSNIIDTVANSSILNDKLAASIKNDSLLSELQELYIDYSQYPVFTQPLQNIANFMQYFQEFKVTKKA